jgi:hypothetical protein
VTEGRTTCALRRQLGRFRSNQGHRLRAPSGKHSFAKLAAVYVHGHTQCCALQSHEVSAAELVCNFICTSAHSAKLHVSARPTIADTVTPSRQSPTAFFQLIKRNSKYESWSSTSLAKAIVLLPQRILPDLSRTRPPGFLYL